MNGLVVITGANGQLGSYLAKAWAEGKQQLLLLFHQDTKRIDELRGLPGICLKSCNLLDLTALKTALEEGCQELGAQPAGLVHCAAIRSSDAKTLAESDPKMFDEVFSSNVTMAYNAVRACLPGMLKREYGRILLLGSNVVQTGLPSGSAYSAAKAAIVNLVRSVALEAAPSNVLINAISPAPIETDLEADYQGEYLAFRQRYFETYKKMSPTGKLISLEELRLTVEFLLDSSLQNLTGQNIILDGGLSAPILNSPNNAT